MRFLRRAGRWLVEHSIEIAPFLVFGIVALNTSLHRILLALAVCVSVLGLWALYIIGKK